MRLLRKGLILLSLILLVIPNLGVVIPVNAQDIPKPAVPQFSIQYTDYSYDIPAYNSTDPYTGKQIQHASQHIGNITIEGNIKNQPFTQYSVPNPPNGSISDTVSFYYNVRYKGHFGNDWTEIYGYHNKDFIYQNYSSQYTTFKIQWQEFPAEGTQIDYQVKALIGFEGRTYIGPYPKPIIIGQESDWSNTLTLVFSKNESQAIAYASNIDNTPYPTLPTLTSFPSPSPIPTESTATLIATGTSSNPTDSISLPLYIFVVIFAVLAVSIVAISVLVLRRHRKTATKKK